MAFGDERRHMYAQRKKQTQLVHETESIATNSNETTIEQGAVPIDETGENTTGAKSVTLSMLNNW